MRWWMMALAATLLSACGLKGKLPEGPVMSPWERLYGWPQPPPSSGVTYLSEPEAVPPVLPVLAWGAAYDLDLVVMSRHPGWNMHEYARLTTPSGPVWLVKEARAGTLDQYLIADLPDIESWMSELPLVRKSAPVKVDDRTTLERVDVTLSYENFDGEAVTVHYRGKPPVDAIPKRNGSTMGHSRRQVMAVLDLPYRGLFGHVDLDVDGRSVGIRRIVPGVPFAMTLVQTQAGLAIGHFREIPVEGGGFTWEKEGGQRLDWRVEPGGGGFEVIQESAMRTLRYRFEARDGAAELSRITTSQWGRATPTSTIELSPPLPDLRRRFEGRHRSRYAIDVNGQQNHAVGWLEAWWEADGPRVELRPEAPWWTADRPMRTTVRFVDGGVDVKIERIAD